jgi:hypothetical protein
MRWRRSFKQCKAIIDPVVIDGVRKDRIALIKNMGVVMGIFCPKREFLSDSYDCLHNYF